MNIKQANERLRKFGIVAQAAVIVLCVLTMLILPDFRVHPVVVLCYAVCVLMNNLTRKAE